MATAALYLYIAGLIAPPAAVVVGLLLLAIPRKARTRESLRAVHAA